MSKWISKKTEKKILEYFKKKNEPNTQPSTHGVRTDSIQPQADK